MRQNLGPPPDLRDPSPAKVDSLPGYLSLVTRASAVGHAPVQGHAYPAPGPLLVPAWFLPRCPAWENWEKSWWKSLYAARSCFRENISSTTDADRTEKSSRSSERDERGRPARAHNTEGPSRARSQALSLWTARRERTRTRRRVPKSRGSYG